MSMCRSTSVAPLTPTYHLRSPTGDKPWYLHRGKLAAVLHHAFHLGLTNEGRESINYKEAMEGPESEKWLEAMKSEIDSMYANKVWTMVDIPEDRKAVENKWIFKKKTDAQGNVSVYKARLVAKGFRQIQGVDYEETFSPVAMIKSIRILLAIAAYHDYEIWQMDVKTAFLNGN